MCAAKRLSESERKQEIMDSAAKVIIAKGFEKTTMEEIIAGTSLSKGGVYHHYRSVIEIFKDIMLCGIEYRHAIILEHLTAYEQNLTKEFTVKELVTKMVDDNPYTPLYIEFLMAKKRNPELASLMQELQEQTKEKFKMMSNSCPRWVEDDDTFQFVTDFTNAMILAANLLDARENFSKNRHILEQMMMCIFDNQECDGTIG